MGILTDFGPCTTQVGVGGGEGVKVGVMVAVRVAVAVGLAGRTAVWVAVGWEAASTGPSQPERGKETIKIEKTKNKKPFIVVLMINYWLSSQMIRNPSRVSHGAMISITSVSLATSSARPPVAITFICLAHPGFRNLRSARKGVLQWLGVTILVLITDEVRAKQGQ